jgi:hypothetical protein
MVILNVMFAWLVQAGYLAGNSRPLSPWMVFSNSPASSLITVTRSSLAPPFRLRN